MKKSEGTPAKTLKRYRIANDTRIELIVIAYKVVTKVLILLNNVGH